MGASTLYVKVETDTVVRGSERDSETPAPDDATRAAPHWRSGLRRPASVVVSVLVGWTTLWATARVLEVTISEPVWRRGILVGVCVGALLVALLVLWAVRRGLLTKTAAADTTVVLTAVSASGLVTWGLNGTLWGVSGLYADSSFRSQAATRYADNLMPVDYAYQDLPAYYPPALGWLQGRVADLFDLPGWQVLKPSQLLLAALIPLLAYVLWQRVLTPARAAAVVLATTLLASDLQKPDEWLVLACLVPWWLDAIREVRREGARAWPAWRYGLVPGLLLLTHTFYFLPIAAATVLGMGIDLWRRRPMRPSMRRAAVIGVVSLVISSPYWLAMVALRLAGPSSDNLQMRYSFPWADLPPVPLPTSVAGILGMIGVVWLLRSLWIARKGLVSPSPLVGGLAVLLAAGYLTMAVGAVTKYVGLPLLTFKTAELLVSVQVICGVIGIGGVLASRRVKNLPQVIRVPVKALVPATVAAAAVTSFAMVWSVGFPAVAAQSTRYPSGSWPEGRQDPASISPAFINDKDPSVAQVRAEWESLSGQEITDATVLATTRVDLIATTDLHPFMTWKSIYSHPNGEFKGRVALLRRVAACESPECAASLLRENPYDAIDGLILQSAGGEPYLPLIVDNFPNKNRTTKITFPRELFASEAFEVSELGRLTFIAVR